MSSPPFFAVPGTPQPDPKRQRVYVSPDANTSTPSTTPQHSHNLNRPQESASVPPSPYAGLSDQQIKRLEKEFKKTDSKIEFARALLGMSGTDLSKEEVVKLVAKWSDQTPEARTYSVLTAYDFNRLCPYIRNFICINDQRLIEAIPDADIPDAFLAMLDITRNVSSRRNEMGTRKIINIFLDVAVYIARKIFSEDRLVVHQEYDTIPTDIPEIGIVSGPLDYVTSRAAGKGSMGKLCA
jgi:hypothetical protein